MKPTEIVEIKPSKCFTQNKLKKTPQTNQTLESGKNTLEDGCITGYIQSSTDQKQTAQQTLSAEGNKRSFTDLFTAIYFTDIFTVDMLNINEIQL